MPVMTCAGTGIVKDGCTPLKFAPALTSVGAVTEPVGTWSGKLGSLGSTGVPVVPLFSMLNPWQM